MKTLRQGYTTGACAAAAAKGAAQIFLTQRPVENIEIFLPSGDKAIFTVHNQSVDELSASCSVFKDAGDDPDITNGAEISAHVSAGSAGSEIEIAGGQGVGRVTKPGLAVLVGEWAINPVPRNMIENSVRDVITETGKPINLLVVISVPKGEELAKKTLNARLGIIGGISILGTTGIVRPISAKAWTDTIDAAVDVAIACKSRSVVLSTGRRSELVAQQVLTLNEEGFVMMGDHVGYALMACEKRGVQEIVLAGQFAKLLKVACGHEQTHVSSSQLDLKMLADWLSTSTETSRFATMARQANTARQVLEESGFSAPLISLVCTKAAITAKRIVGSADIKVLLAGYNSEMLYFA